MVYRKRHRGCATLWPLDALPSLCFCRNKNSQGLYSSIHPTLSWMYARFFYFWILISNTTTIFDGLTLPKMNPSSSPPHLQIFNSIQNTKNEDSCFLPFQTLPIELRLKIWRHSLERERIIKVSFENEPPTADRPNFDGRPFDIVPLWMDATYWASYCVSAESRDMKHWAFIGSTSPASWEEALQGRKGKQDSGLFTLTPNMTFFKSSLDSGQNKAWWTFCITWETPMIPATLASLTLQLEGARLCRQLISASSSLRM